MSLLPTAWLIRSALLLPLSPALLLVVLTSGAAAQMGAGPTTLACDPRADQCQGSDEPALMWVGSIELARRARDYNFNPELDDRAIAFDDLSLTVEWRSPRPPPDVKPPKSAKLYFVLRDQRGGDAFTRRTVAIERE